jgi:hypothetical protein
MSSTTTIRDAVGDEVRGSPASSPSTARTRPASLSPSSARQTHDGGWVGGLW